VTRNAPRSRPAARLRRGRISDLDALVELERGLFQSRRFAGHVISRASLRRFIDSSSASLVIAEAGKQLAGYVLVLYRANSNFARMYSIGVAAHFRRRGLARKLLIAAEEDAIRRRRSAMRLEVRADDPRAIALYKTSGYCLFGRYPRYYDGRTDALRFEKPLGRELTVGRRARGN